MSITNGILLLLLVSSVYGLTVYLSYHYNHGGRDPIDPFYSISQWNPNKLELTSTCTVPAFPGDCVIEGMTGAYQHATHWCQAPNGGPCIDPDSGSLVKGNPIDFLVACKNIPNCGWSQSRLSFGDDKYLNVTFNHDGSISLTNIPDSENPTYFYMERLSVNQGLVKNQNGTLARFFLIGPNNIKYILSYTNNFIPRGTLDPITSLLVQPLNGPSNSNLTLFVLMESMSTSISSVSIPPVTIIPRKILAFGGANRTADPSPSELAIFNQHVIVDAWNAALKEYLVIIRWNTSFPPVSGFYGTPSDRYTKVLNDGPGLVFDLVHDVKESRVRGKSLPFYTWQG